MLKFLLSAFGRTVAHQNRASQEEALLWARDPLSHPSLETMSQRQLGDLPFRR